VSKIRLERDLEKSLCDYPELIDDSLWHIRQGLEVLDPEGPFLKRQDVLPNGRIADLVFVEHARITVVELKKGLLAVSVANGQEDVVDQISNYLAQCRIKYPGREEYRGFIIGSGVSDRKIMETKISSQRDVIRVLVFGKDIPSTISICHHCGRAVRYGESYCACGTIP